MSEFNISTGSTELGSVSRMDLLRSLHVVTLAINENVSATELYQLFQDSMEKDLGIEQMALFVYDHAWKKVIKVPAEDNVTVDFATALCYHHPSVIADKDKAALSNFEYIVPVFHKNKPISFALLGKTTDAVNVEMLLQYAQIITNVITVAIENKRLFKREIEKKEYDKELELASKVQNMLIPRKLPKNHFYEFSGLYLPHKSIGGDYYDVISINKDEFVFCIGDISGKGVAAALVMANLQAFLNASFQFDTQNAAQMIQRLNRKVYSITNGDHFITLFIGKYNILTRELTYINAGHNPPILINGSEVSLLQKGCTLLGIFDEIPRVQSGRVTLEANAAIVCYTDGLTELEDEEGNLYGMDRLTHFCRRHHTFSPEIIVKILYDHISKFKGECLFNDDVSVLVGKFY